MAGFPPAGWVRIDPGSMLAHGMPALLDLARSSGDQLLDLVVEQERPTLRQTRGSQEGLDKDGANQELVPGAADRRERFEKRPRRCALRRIYSCRKESTGLATAVLRAWEPTAATAAARVRNAARIKIPPSMVVRTV